MNGKNTTRSTWIIPLLLGVMACCAFIAVFVCLGVLLLFPMQRHQADVIPTVEAATSTPFILPTSTLIPEPTLTPIVAPLCEDANCLKACLREIPDFAIEPLAREDIRDLRKKEGGYDVIRYKLHEENKTLKRIAIPTVPDYLLPYQEDEELHQRIWDTFSGIFPNNAEDHVSYLIVVMDASDDGYSAAIWNSQGKWRLYVNLLEFDSSKDVIEILTHEYGHMVTLNKAQVKVISDLYGLEMERSDYDTMQSKCNGYFFTGSECALQNSYLDEFGSRFWNGELLETWIDAFLLMDKDDGQYDDAMADFYLQYSDQFVTHYASTDPVEDIAESWTEFMVRPKPTGSSVADQKILFFYEYPELVELRREIIQGVCQYAEEQK